MKNYILSKETLENMKIKISNKMKGRKYSLLHRQHMSETRKRLLKEGKVKMPTEQQKLFRRTQIFDKKDSSIEIKIQNFLKELNINFFTHQYINIEHGYQCDVLIPSMNLVIECDGVYWHKYPTGRDIDKIRTSELIQKGFKVLRLWENEIKVLNLDQFKNKLQTI